MARGFRISIWRTDERRLAPYVRANERPVTACSIGDIPNSEF
ncbi:MAG: hypothetical protein QOH31_6874 [Verrucomicrobiota bacterium]|jgi:hypothetical protein